MLWTAFLRDLAHTLRNISCVGCVYFGKVRKLDLRSFLNAWSAGGFWNDGIMQPAIKVHDL